MNLRAAFLARTATSRPDGTFDVQGGGITDFEIRQGLIIGAPLRLEFSLVLRLELDVDEIEQLQAVRVQIMYEGEERGSGEVPLVGRRVPGETFYYHNLIVQFVVDVPRPGAGYLLLTWDGGLVSIPRIHFRVGRPASS